jgi:peptidase E
MKQQYKNYYQFTKPPKALLQAKHDNIAIVPASMLPFTKTIQQVLNNLPKGAVFLCHAEENTRQRKLLERVEETFRQQGYLVKNLSMSEVYNNTTNF